MELTTVSWKCKYKLLSYGLKCKNLKMRETSLNSRLDFFSDQREILCNNLKPTLSQNQDKFEILAQELDQAHLKKEISRLNRK